MLDTRRMQILRAVISSGSVTSAATNLGYTASAVSQQLAALEREAGVPLLEKDGRGVRPTQAGKMVAEQAALIAKVLADTTAELAAFRDGCAGRLRVRWAASVGAALIPPAVAAYRAKNPDVRIEPCISRDPLKELTDGDADLALLALPTDSSPLPGIDMVHLLDDPFRVVLPADHPLAELPEIDLAKLANERWVEIATNAATDAYHGLLRDACASAGFAPNIAVRADDFLTAQGFVAAGLGVRLASNLGLGFGGSSQVVVRPVRNPEPRLRIYIATRDLIAKQATVASMLDELRTAATALVRAAPREVSAQG